MRTIDIIIRGKDAFSRTLGGIRGSLGSITQGIGLGIGSALTESVLSGIGNIVGAAGDQFQKAVDFEIEEISGANTLLSLGVYDNLRDSTDALRGLTKNLSGAASVLPGDTEDYRRLLFGLADDLVFALEDGGDDVKKGLDQASKDLIPKLGVLQTASGLTTAQVSKGISKFLGGSSQSLLEGLILFQSDPTFRNKLFANQGEFEDTANGRLKALTKTMQEVYSDETLEALGNTFDGSIQGLKDQLFGNSGIFSFSRDLFGDIEGDQSILTAVKDGLNALVGENSLFGAITRAFGSFGDPLIVFYNGLLILSSKINGLKDIFNQVANGESGIFELRNDLEFFVNESYRQLLKTFVTDPLAGIISYFQNQTTSALDLSFINGFLGVFFDAILVDPLNAYANDPSSFNQAVSNAFVIIGLILKAIAESIVLALVSIQWRPLLENIALTIVTGFNLALVQIGVLFEKIGAWLIRITGLNDLKFNDVLNGIGGLFNRLVGMLLSFSPAGLQARLYEAIGTLGSKLWNAITGINIKSLIGGFLSGRAASSNQAVSQGRTNVTNNSSVRNFSPSVNVANASGNGQEIASQVINEIDRLFLQEQYTTA